jgi:hypothetical protein
LTKNTRLRSPGASEAISAASSIGRGARTTSSVERQLAHLLVRRLADLLAEASRG